MGKGSARRPTQISHEEEEKRWAETFRYTPWWEKRDPEFMAEVEKERADYEQEKAKKVPPKAGDS